MKKEKFVKGLKIFAKEKGTNPKSIQVSKLAMNKLTVLGYSDKTANWLRKKVFTYRGERYGNY